MCLCYTIKLLKASYGAICGCVNEVLFNRYLSGSLLFLTTACETVIISKRKASLKKEMREKS